MGIKKQVRLRCHLRPYLLVYGSSEKRPGPAADSRSSSRQRRSVMERLLVKECMSLPPHALRSDGDREPWRQRALDFLRVGRLLTSSGSWLLNLGARFCNISQRHCTASHPASIPPCRHRCRGFSSPDGFFFFLFKYLGHFYSRAIIAWSGRPLTTARF